MAIVMVLFTLLQCVNAGFAALLNDAVLDRLTVSPRAADNRPLPASYLEEIRKIDGVVDVARTAVFFGFAQGQADPVIAFAVDPDAWIATRPPFTIAKADIDTFRTTRIGLLATENLRARFGWEVGDRVPIQSPIRRMDGEGTWEFDFVGVLQAPDNESANSFEELAIIQYDYLEEARAGGKGTVNQFIVRVADANRSAAVAKTIDARFLNSSNSTRTQSDRAEVEAQLAQLGDVGFFTNLVGAAALFCLLFLTGNTMAQSIRERLPEFSVLKTVGFSNEQLALFVILESMSICLAAELIALLLAIVAFHFATRFLDLMSFSFGVVANGFLVASGVAICSVVLPVLRLRRLQIVEVLRVVK